ncbi:hypothetical protein M2322_004578 [Rhodoblastus acidophilus]|uniref:helix-turn-helix domain-containing protein n=1 Tax=Rhodoblastus acidophilus TaxID=1074 RepID=UPI002224D827|nr:helix-turn-helix domain-containing protein [Rhodoblastus acidophilus]MCW2319009.1 hypothetical protein [Rhodoblastus acidophilus]
MKATTMTSLHLETAHEPRSSAELIARYRAARQRLESAGKASKRRPPIRDLVGTEPATVPRTIPSQISAPIPAACATPEDLVATIDLSRGKFGRILKMVSERTGVSIADILGEGRRAPIVAARQEAMWAVKTITNWSLPRIGGRFNRDHTTVLHAIRQVEARADQDADLRAFMDAVKNAFC